MKKNVFVLALFAVVSMCFTSCSKDELEEGNVATVEHEIALTRASIAPELEADGWVRVGKVATNLYKQKDRFDENNVIVVWAATTDADGRIPTADQVGKEQPFKIPVDPKRGNYGYTVMRGELYTKDGASRYEWEKIIWLETSNQAHSGGLLR